ncbi:hypothetical protein M422DRAFT_161600, partial [Sphaerobolus stellatus SS14]
IRIWNAYTGELVSGPFEGHTSVVSSVAFSPDGQRVVSGSYDKIIRIWNAHTGELVSQLFEGHTDQDTGYITGPNKELIFWIPFSYHERLWLPHYLAIMGMDTVTLDLSQFAHGPSWTECWKSE